MLDALRQVLRLVTYMINAPDNNTRLLFIAGNVSIFIIFLASFLVLHKTRNTMNFARKNLYAVLQSSKKLSDDRRKKTAEYMSLYGDVSDNSFTALAERLLKYSLLDLRASWLTPELSIMLICAFVLISVTIMFSVFEFVTACVGELVILVCAYGFIMLKTRKIQDSISTQSVQFIDTLCSMGQGTNDILLMIEKTQPHMKGVFADLLSTAIATAKAKNNKMEAISVISEHTAFPALKQLLMNIEITSRGSADYLAVISSQKELLQVEMESREQLRHDKNSSRVELLILVAVLMVCVYFICQMFMNISILEGFALLAKSFFGKVILVYTFAVITAILINIMTGDELFDE